MAPSDAPTLPRPDDWDALAAIGHWLRPCFGGETVAPAPDQNWAAIIEIASRNMVAPALGWVWATQPGLPPDIAQVFAALLAMNRERNARMLAGVEEMLVVLNREGIVPVLLKGTGMLADRTYPDPGLRVILDCDMLVREPEVLRASAILTEAGYVPTKRKALRGSHHLPMHRHVDTGVGVELHHQPGQRELARLIDAQRCFENGRVVTVGAGRALLPAIEDRIVHNIGHLQVMDRRYRMAKPHLRQLLDVAMFRHAHDPSIDWAAVSDRFRRAGLHPILTDNLGLVEALLGQPAPAGLGGGAASAERRVRHALARGPVARTARTVQWTLADALRMIAADPRWIGVWIGNARARGSITGGIRRRARTGG